MFTAWKPHNKNQRKLVDTICNIKTAETLSIYNKVDASSIKHYLWLYLFTIQPMSLRKYMHDNHPADADYTNFQDTL